MSSLIQIDRSFSRLFELLQICFQIHAEWMAIICRFCFCLYIFHCTKFDKIFSNLLSVTLVIYIIYFYLKQLKGFSKIAIFIAIKLQSSGNLLVGALNRSITVCIFKDILDPGFTPRAP